MPRPLGGHVFPPTGTIFELIQDIIGTNHLTKFHDDRTINVASRVLTRKNAPPPDIIRTNLLTKFHEDRKINVASRVLTRKNAPPPGSHVFQPTSIIFELVQDIIGVNLLTKFHEDLTINVASRVHIKKNAPPLGSHVFQANVTIFKLIQDIIETNLLTKFHEDWTINVASRVFTKKNAPPLDSHVFQANVTIFELIQVLTRKNAPPLGSHVFQANVTIFELIHVLTRKTAPPPGGHFHDDSAKIVTSRVFTRNTAPPPGGFDWASNGTSTVFTSFELNQTINVASRVFTRQNVDDGRRTMHDGQKAITKAYHEGVVLRNLLDWSLSALGTQNTLQIAFIWGRGNAKLGSEENQEENRVSLEEKNTTLKCLFRMITTGDYLLNIPARTAGHILQECRDNLPIDLVTFFDAVLTSFELETNVLTKFHQYKIINKACTFHEDRALKVACRIFTVQIFTIDIAQQTTAKASHKS
ncbi:hypothetical protein DPMN_012799 [Dreissena polymorpha]|uniref:Uncharacterized protein n=1 Tax=Dreissena polymorpha TaxID=45954 RepID=A0A9D4N7N7_DREPO|nr:hypothetical protein DPMN_012799 [Dreissena polymorpha]